MYISLYVNNSYKYISLAILLFYLYNFILNSHIRSYVNITLYNTNSIYIMYELWILNLKNFHLTFNI